MEEKMETINLHFNDGWNFLAKYFPSANLPNGHSLNIGIKPKKLDRALWKDIINNLISVMEIGRRNKWLYYHVDYQGRVAFLHVPTVK